MMTNSKAIEDLKALKDYFAHECGMSYPICLEYAIKVLEKREKPQTDYASYGEREDE